MANSPQSSKRARQSVTHRLLNQSAKTRMRTLVKRTRAAAADPEKAKAAFADMQVAVDRAGRKGLIHPKTAARLKSRVNRLLKTGGAKAVAAKATAENSESTESAEEDTDDSEESGE